MSIIGSSCLVLSGGQFREAIIRASSQPLFDATNLSQARVLLEWCDSDCRREWVDLTNSESFQAVYIEKELRWARRVVPTEQPRAVAWPARAFIQLFSSVPQPPDTLVVEYFLDKERAHLFFNETKPLIPSEAKPKLSQHPEMLQELAQWEEAAAIKEMLTSNSSQLTGCHVNVCNVQQPQNWISGVVTYHNTQTKELTVVEDCTGSTHTVNPLMVHVLVTSPDEVHGSWQPHSHPPPLTLNTSPVADIPSTGSPATLSSPHLASPIIQECPSPQFNLNNPNRAFPSPSIDPMYPGSSHRRLSLQQSMSMMRSEPNIHRRCSLDPLTLKKLTAPFELHPTASIGQSQSLGRLPLHSNSPSASHLHSSPHGSNSHLSTHGSNSSLNDQLYPTFTSPDDPTLEQQELRSKSLGNIYSSLSSHSQQQQPRQQTSPIHQQQQQQQALSQQQQQQALSQQQQLNMPLQQASPVGSAAAAVHQHQQQHQQLPTLSSGALGAAGVGNVAGGSGAGSGGGAVSGGSGGGGVGAQKRRASYGFNNLTRSTIKRPRFEVLPTIMDPQAEHSSGDTATGDLRSTLSYTLKSLSRSASQPVVFPRKHLDRRLNKLNSGGGGGGGGGHHTSGGCGTGSVGGAGGGSSGEGGHEDDLDIIKQIIEKDETLHDTPDQVRQGGGGGIHFRSQSLSHIPGEFSSVSSLPTLHHGESMHLLHSNYFSAPDFSQLSSPPGYNGMKHGGAGGGGDMGAGDSPYHQLTHESRSSSLGDCHAAVPTPLGGGDASAVTNQNQPLGGSSAQQQHQNNFGVNGDRRGSIFDSPNSISTAGYATNTQQSGPLSLSHHSEGFGSSHVTTYDFTRHRDSSHSSLLYSESDGSHTPATGGYNSSSAASTRRESNLSDGISSGAASISFQFPSLPGGGTCRTNPLSSFASTPTTSQDSNRLGGGSGESSSNLPLRDYLTSQSATAAGVCKTAALGGGAKDGVTMESPNIVPEAEILSVGADDDDSFHSIDDLGEFSISRIINQHAAGGEDMDGVSFSNSMEDSLGSPSAGHASSSTAVSSKEKTKRTKVKSNQQPKDKGNQQRRTRGRPRLTEEEKQRRKELRDLGLMKRSKRRTKEQVAEWRKQKILAPAKRGRKPGSGKKNIIKAATGKVVYVSVDISRYPNGTVLLQNGFCRAFPGVPKCLDCGTAEDDLPASRYCRFLEFRKLHIVENSQPLITVEGFSNYSDVNTDDIVPWTPLRAGFGRMDEQAAMFILRKVVAHFISIVTEQAKTLPDDNVVPIWKRAVQGIRELCDTCDTSIFNFHWLCKNCGFCICPACYHLACDSENGVEAVSSMTTAAWPPCVYNSQPHKPSGLILAQIIPANVLGNVVVQLLQVCSANKIQVSAPPVIQRLVNALSLQEPQSKFVNETSKKSKNLSPPKKSFSPQLPPQLLNQDMTYPPPPHAPSSISSSAFHSSLDDLSSLELPHSCSNGNDDQLESLLVSAPHLWLCDGSLLCLLEPRHPDNLSAFQERWRRGQVVVVTGVDRYLNKELWTPQAFERDFGEEPADLVDCRLGMVLLQLPSKTFWAGFDNMSLRLIDPTTDEPRLLKLKDWPTGDDFSEKLPKRYEDLSNALPLPDYTRRDGKYNMAASLPSFFVKPDLGPKMYNAYGSPAYPSSGTTNLHLDISSAVNVMVHCSVPASVAEQERKLIEETVAAECCPETLRRIRETGAQVGAIWHIFHASDTDKLRAFLRKVYEERGLRPASGTDPIHDQLLYLDFDLRQRLYQEYGVKGWAIAQCVGDAIFIPAGAPHQVRNVCSCIKVAEDFVAPEQISECLKLTEEFRQLSDRHANHEDKLQVKNIIFHSMKDIVGLLKSTVK